MCDLFGLGSEGRRRECASMNFVMLRNVSNGHECGCRADMYAGIHKSGCGNLLISAHTGAEEEKRLGAVEISWIDHSVWGSRIRASRQVISTFSRTLGSCWATMGVLVIQGATQLTLMPSTAHSPGKIGLRTVEDEKSEMMEGRRL